MTVNHLKVVATGSYADTSDSVEGWAIGVRLLVNGGLTPPNVGTLPTLTVSPNFASGTATDYTWDKTFDIGSGGSFLFPEDYFANQAVPAFEAFIYAVAANTARLQKVSLYPQTTPLGKSDGNSAHAYMTATSGGSQGDMLPTEVAGGVSWQTQILGPSGRGRIYAPAMPKSGIAANGLFTSSYRTVLLNAGVALLEGLAFDQSLPGTLKVRPIVTGKGARSLGSPYTRYGVITEVRCGLVPDSQRRRRRSLAESYTNATPTYP